MKVVIDTSSLLSLVRYYLPFDTEDKLNQVFQTKVECGEIVILDKVAEECGYVAGGIDHQFVNTQLKSKLNDTEYEARKAAYLENADAKIILYAYTQNRLGTAVTVVSEESSAGNDDKMYKKIPNICSSIGIKCIQLPELLRMFNEIAVKF